MISFSETSGRIKADLTCVPMGNDLCVIISGGEVPHLGAVSVSQVRKSLSDSQKISSSTSIITLLGHKEDALAKEVSESLASQLNKNIVCCCGIHLDNATSTEIETVIIIVKKLICRLRDELNK
ncbi:hypothetical protein [Desulfitobacterium sp. AusDCA]|uniref:prenylated flavin chaperone LpdD n=1 Tax=Desulfitobacterium sp. AusDCA TaxID=3240383 RepID=UPI003DA6CEFF